MKVNVKRLRRGIRARIRARKTQRETRSGDGA
jgi:hypothetical protein